MSDMQKDLYKYYLLGHNKKQTTRKQKQNVKGKGSYVIIAKGEVIYFVSY